MDYKNLEGNLNSQRDGYGVNLRFEPNQTLLSKLQTEYEHGYETPFMNLLRNRWGMTNPFDVDSHISYEDWINLVDNTLTRALEQKSIEDNVLGLAHKEYNKSILSYYLFRLTDYKTAVEQGQNWNPAEHNGRPVTRNGSDWCELYQLDDTFLAMNSPEEDILVLAPNPLSYYSFDVYQGYLNRS